MTDSPEQEPARETHNPECHHLIAATWPCTCARIDAEDEAWRQEPPDMFARESF